MAPIASEERARQTYSVPHGSYYARHEITFDSAILFWYRKCVKSCKMHVKSENSAVLWPLGTWAGNSLHIDPQERKWNRPPYVQGHGTFGQAEPYKRSCSNMACNEVVASPRRNLPRHRLQTTCTCTRALSETGYLVFFRHQQSLGGCLTPRVLFVICTGLEIDTCTS